MARATCNPRAAKRKYTCDISAPTPRDEERPRSSRAPTLRTPSTSTRTTVSTQSGAHNAGAWRCKGAKRPPWHAGLQTPESTIEQRRSPIVATAGRRRARPATSVPKSMWAICPAGPVRLICPNEAGGTCSSGTMHISSNVATTAKQTERRGQEQSMRRSRVFT